MGKTLNYRSIERFRSHGLKTLQAYWMVVVLVMLCALFSVLTLTQQHPTGPDAGRQVAERLLTHSEGSVVGVVILTRDISDDRAYAAALVERLESADVKPLAVVSGSPMQARLAVEGLVQSGKQIDYIAANEATANWVIYDSIDGVDRDKLIVPQSYTWPNFLKPTNLVGVANQTAIYAIIAIGMTLVIITAGIDLSVGSLVALAAVTGALVMRNIGGGIDWGPVSTLLGIAAGVGVCALAGLFNGLMVTFFRLPSFIVTLAMMLMASGLAFRLSSGASISELPESFFILGGGETLGLPNPVWLMAGLYLVAQLVMTRMKFGRYVYAIGGNPEAARLSGVPVRSVILAVYSISAALAGLGGMILASKLRAGDPKFGQMYELEVIAAVVVGGASLLGGSGRIFGTLVGAFIIAVIKNGMNLTNVDPFNQRIVLGAVLLAAILIDRLKHLRPLIRSKTLV